jgi:hypothetical protein
LPIVSLDEIQFPVKVYMHENIVTMRRAQFAALAGYQRAA